MLRGTLHDENILFLLHDFFDKSFPAYNHGGEDQTSSAWLIVSARAGKQKKWIKLSVH